ncbi:hypothetical protein J6590_075037 [Homalodisca vitripennis]|nr:hypothetical protein J6590_075037 [Homalodisca vitripennis]
MLFNSSIQTNYSAVDSYFKILCIPLHNSSPPPFAYGTEQNILKTCPKTEIERLTDQYFGHLYSNYHVTRPVLVRQARDLLVCSYHGNTARFEAEFCQPAAAIMAEVIQRSVIEHIINRSLCCALLVPSMAVRKPNAASCRRQLYKVEQMRRSA